MSRFGRLLRKGFALLPESLQRFLIRKHHLRFNAKRTFGSDITKRQHDVKVKKTIIVIGMHRSGTSLVGQLLVQSGVKLGTELIGPKAENPRGYIENRFFVQMNDKIFARCGGSWDIPPRYESILKMASEEDLMEEIRLLVEVNKESVWGWKDPRTTFTLDLYRPFLENCHIITCERDELSIARSLRARNNFSIEKGINLTRCYNGQIEKLMSRLQEPVLHLKYENWFQDERKQLELMSSFLSIDMSACKGVVDPALRRNG